jgi:hypothetical protein
MIDHEHIWRNERCIFCGIYQLVETPVKKKTGPKPGRAKKVLIPEATPAKMGDSERSSLSVRIPFLRSCLERAERLDLPIQARLYREELERLEERWKRGNGASQST